MKAPVAGSYNSTVVTGAGGTSPSIPPAINTPLPARAASGRSRGIPALAPVGQNPRGGAMNTGSSSPSSSSSRSNGAVRPTRRSRPPAPSTSRSSTRVVAGKWSIAIVGSVSVIGSTESSVGAKSPRACTSMVMPSAAAPHPGSASGITRTSVRERSSVPPHATRQVASAKHPRARIPACYTPRVADVPSTFGKYFLTEKLAVGGMAEIYLAKLVGPGGFEKQLIIKQIHPRLSDQPQFVDLFVTEAKTLVGLSHGNIVPIYELGVVDDRYFIAMEYIDGPTLEKLQRALHEADQEMDPAVACYVTAELLKGLDYAHRKGEGVVHRDLSPRNVMISRDGEVKLVDFGIAVALEEQPDASASSPGIEPGTRPEGSYPYMSPEQVRREQLTGQSDLFSAGVLLWEMLTGEMLFARDSAEATLEAVVSAPIEPPSKLRAGLPAELDAICLRALARDRERRWDSAGQFLGAVNKWLYAHESPVSPAVLARLVATRCPPVRRRAPSVAGGHEGIAADELSGPVTQVDRTPVNAKDPSDHTRPLPRDGAPGTRRAGTKTFATNVHFQQDVLSKATPLFPIQAIVDDSPPSDSTQPRQSSKPPPALAKATATPDAEETAAVPRQRPGRTALIAAIVVIALAAASTIVWLRLRSGSGNNAVANGRPPADAGTPRPPRTIDAGIVRPPPVDAGIPDARPTSRADAGPPIKRVDAGPVLPKGTGTLVVSATPYGDVYLNDKKLGRAPNSWSVPAGRYKLVVHGPGDQKKSLGIIAIDNDETERVEVTFAAEETP